MALKFIDEIDVKDKRVVARFDFNVPLKEGRKGQMIISDSTRIDRGLETIRYLLDQGAKKLVIMSHLGRPKGKRDERMSLAPVADYISKELQKDVILTESCTDRGIKTILGLNSTQVVLLENLRFHKEEELNDAEFAKNLASYGDIYVNDAFGAAHRKHASVYEIINYFPKGHYVGGLLLKKEIKALNRILEKPLRPFVAIIGGAKVSDKIKIIEALLPKLDHLLIGGAMAYPFLKAKGEEVGQSLCSEEDVKLAKLLLKSSTHQKIILPSDHMIASSFDEPAAESCSQIKADMMGLDIGEKTIEQYHSLLNQAKTVLWNGPMGLFEKEAFSQGTLAIAKKLAQRAQEDPQFFGLVGGGDSVSAVNQSGIAEQINHISTGGGASLEYIEKGSLPGVNALRFGSGH